MEDSIFKQKDTIITTARKDDWNNDDKTMGADSNSDWKQEKDVVDSNKRNSSEMGSLVKNAGKISKQNQQELKISNNGQKANHIRKLFTAVKKNCSTSQDVELFTSAQSSFHRKKVLLDKELEYSARSGTMKSKSENEKHLVKHLSEQSDCAGEKKAKLNSKFEDKEKSKMEESSFQDSAYTGTSDVSGNQEKESDMMKSDAEKTDEVKKNEKETTFSRDNKANTLAAEGWFYLSGGVSTGPVSWTELLKKCTELETLVWRKDLTNWVPLGDLMRRSAPKQIEYYYQDVNGKQKGPVSKWDVINMSTGGEIRRDSLVWRTGMTSWCIIGNLKEFEMVQDVKERVGNEEKSCVLARKKSGTSKKCLLGSLVWICDTMHVFKDINKTTFLDPWPSVDGLTSFEVKYRAGLGYWKTKGFEITTGLKGKVVFHWGGDKNTIRLIKISDRDEDIFVAVKAQGLTQVESLDDMAPPAKKQRTDVDSSLKKSNRDKIYNEDSHCDGGFSSWLNNQGY